MLIYKKCLKAAVTRTSQPLQLRTQRQEVAAAAIKDAAGRSVPKRQDAASRSGRLHDAANQSNRV